MKNIGREQEMSQDVVINKILIIFICVLLQRTMDVPCICIKYAKSLTVC